jgi:hypothetical protein
MTPSTAFEPTHLGVFAADATTPTRAPIARMPLYAEVALSAPLRPSDDLDSRFADDDASAALRHADPESADDERARARIVAALAGELTRLLADDMRDELAADRAAKVEFLTDALRRARAQSGRPLRGLRPDELAHSLEAGIQAAAEHRDLTLNAPTPPQMATWSHPLGILATDHAGYLSFDLTRLPDSVYAAVMAAVEARRRDPGAQRDVAVWLYPMARNAPRFDALDQGRFADDAIVARLELEPPDLPSVVRNLGIPALQNPGLSDWRLSPVSFAGTPAALLGEDGCESLLPANVALQEFNFYQVVRVTNAQAAVPHEVAAQVRLGVVQEYRLAWYPVGHSLGQILYSLPLAPGESVKLAVIDWTRRDDAQRKEHTTLDEQLVHEEHRDRSITETVNAAINEYQHGSSFMGGLAESVGLGAGLGAGAGLAAGLAGSLGGSTASSSGTREIAGTTVQKLSDNVTQASAARRELNSTVVVHSTEAEKEAIETRTVANYNHSHALTILYYEVLRHFRVVTELVRRRPAVLVKMRTDWFPEAEAKAKAEAKAEAEAEAETNIRENRAALQAALLDQKFAEGFNALDRIAHRQALNPSPPPDGPASAPAKPAATCLLQVRDQNRPLVCKRV